MYSFELRILNLQIWFDYKRKLLRKSEIKNAKFSIAETIIISLEKSNRSNNIKQSSTKRQTKPNVDTPPNQRKNKSQLPKNLVLKNDILTRYDVKSSEKSIVDPVDRQQNIEIVQNPVNLVIEENMPYTSHQQSTAVQQSEHELVIDLTAQNQTNEPVSRNDKTGILHTLLTNMNRIYETQCSIDNTLKLMLAEMKRNHQS